MRLIWLQDDADVLVIGSDTDAVERIVRRDEARAFAALTALADNPDIGWAGAVRLFVSDSFSAFVHRRRASTCQGVLTSQ